MSHETRVYTVIQQNISDSCCTSTYSEVYLETIEFSFTNSCNAKYEKVYKQTWD